MIGKHGSRFELIVLAAAVSSLEGDNLPLEVKPYQEIHLSQISKYGYTFTTHKTKAIHILGNFYEVVYRIQLRVRANEVQRNYRTSDSSIVHLVTQAQHAFRISNGSQAHLFLHLCFQGSVEILREVRERCSRIDYDPMVEETEDL